MTSEQATPAEGAKEAARASGFTKFPAVLAAIAVVVWCLDQGSKQWIQSELGGGGRISIIGDFFRFVLVYNPGAAFSMGVNYTWVLTGIAIAVTVGIIIMSRRLGSWLWTVGLAMILGGALGNLTDRLFRAPGPGLGHVVDFIAVGNFAVFNIADSSICCGAAIMVLATLRGVGIDGRTDTQREAEKRDTETRASEGGASE
ncbi:signal peptidase II [Micrococcales bacterium 31B]|nr:signal peptidase II [Micrococcales bacterium 31B]